MVMSPQSLTDVFSEQEAQIPASYANFGYIPYGQTIMGSIHFDTEN
jgi:hypothetical protein